MCVSRSCSVERVMLEAIGRNMHSEDAPCLMMGGLMTRGCGCCQPWPHGLPQLIRSLCDVGQSVALIQCIADVPACRALRACMSPSSVPVWPRNRPKLTSARSLHAVQSFIQHVRFQDCDAFMRLLHASLFATLMIRKLTNSFSSCIRLTILTWLQWLTVNSFDDVLWTRSSLFTTYGIGPIAEIKQGKKLQTANEQTVMWPK